MGLTERSNRPKSEEYFNKVSGQNGFYSNNDNLKLGFVEDTNYYDKDLNNYNFAKIEEILSTLDSKDNPIRTALIDSLYPVHSIYITATNTNPSSFLGGNWEQIATGRCLFGIGGISHSDTTPKIEEGKVGGHAQPYIQDYVVGEHTHTVPGGNRTQKKKQTLHNKINPVVQLNKSQAGTEKIIITQVPVRKSSIEAAPPKKGTKERKQWDKEEKTKPVKDKGIIWIPYLDSNINWGANILDIEDEHSHEIDERKTSTANPKLSIKADVEVESPNKSRATGNIPPYYPVYFWRRMENIN